jgi:hypothetical protein
LSAPFTGTHIHGPSAAATSASVMINLLPQAVGTPGTNGLFIVHTSLTAAQKAILLDGRAYVNVHSTNFPSGEIRGHLAPTLYKANLSGQAERPTPVRTPGRGHGLLTLVRGQLGYNVAYSGLVANANNAHIHGPANQQTAATVMIGLNNSFLGGQLPAGNLMGATPLTADQRAALVDGLTYINIHTATNSSGEIRGQILP